MASSVISRPSILEPVGVNFVIPEPTKISLILPIPYTAFPLCSITFKSVSCGGFIE